jgi:hypothetical protein
VKHPATLLCLEDFDNSTCIRPDVRATRPDTLQCSRRIYISFVDMDRERQLATVRKIGQHRPDVALIWKRVKRVMERQLHSSPSGRSMPPPGRCLEKSESVTI